MFQPAFVPTFVSHTTRETIIAATEQARYSVLFNGTSSDIDFGNTGTLGSFIAGNALTIDCWINLSDLPYFGSGVILSKVRDGDIYCLLFDVSNLGYYRIRGSLSTISGFDEPISTAEFPNAVGEWHHVLMTYDDNGDRAIDLAIDGEWISIYESRGIAVSGLREESNANIGLGRQMFGGSWFAGSISWVRISSAVRYEIGVNFTPPDRCAPPVIDVDTLELWTLDEGSGVTAVASVSPSNSGVMTDCIWQECS